MNDMIVKSVDLFGDSVMAAKDKDGNIWAGVSYFCNALGMSKGQKDRQVKNVQKDRALKRGCVKFDAGVFDANNESIALKIDFVPLWLAKITITDEMEKDHPELALSFYSTSLKQRIYLRRHSYRSMHNGPAICSTQRQIFRWERLQGCQRSWTE